MYIKYIILSLLPLIAILSFLIYVWLEIDKVDIKLSTNEEIKKDVDCIKKALDTKQEYILKGDKDE